MKKDILLFIGLLFSCLSIQAQQERLDDIVPFKKGKLWGLVHHDGKAFYDAVFDKIEMEYTFGIDTTQLYSPVFSVDGYTGKPVIYVTYEKKKYVLTADKQLMSSEKYQELRIKEEKKWVTTEEMKTDIIEDIPPAEKINRSDPYSVLNTARNKILYTDSAIYLKSISGKKIMLKPGHKKLVPGDTLHCFIDGKYIPEFDCNVFAVSDEEKRTGAYSGAILGYDGEKAYADIETGKLTIPFASSAMWFSKHNPNWVINEYKGVMTKDGKQVGRKIRISRESYFPRESIMIASPSYYEEQFYYPLRDSLSPVIYSGLREIYTDYQKNSVTEPLFVVKKDNLSGIITPDGKVIAPFEYDEIPPFPSDIIWLKKNDKWGFIDVRNKYFRMEALYDEHYGTHYLPFSVNGVPYRLFMVKVGDNLFYIDNFGKEFISK